MATLRLVCMYCTTASLAYRLCSTSDNMQEMSLLHMYYELWAIWQLSVTCHIQLSVIVVKVLWYCSYLVWLVFEGSIPTCTCFQLKTFVTCLLCFCFFTSSITTPQVEKKTVYNFHLQYMYLHTCKHVYRSQKPDYTSLDGEAT